MSADNKIIVVKDVVDILKIIKGDHSFFVRAIMVFMLRRDEYFHGANQ